MSLWDEANELDTISNQISCLGNVLELIAEKISSDPESGTLWLCRDVCDNLVDKLQKRMQSLMSMDRQQKDDEFIADFVKNAKIREQAGEE